MYDKLCLIFLKLTCFSEFNLSFCFKDDEDYDIGQLFEGDDERKCMFCHTFGDQEANVSTSVVSWRYSEPNVNISAFFLPVHLSTQAL